MSELPTEGPSAIDLLIAMVDGAGRPYIDPRLDTVTIEVDKRTWQQAEQWLDHRRLDIQGQETLIGLQGTHRADAWAHHFALLFPDAPDEELMLTWFASAIMNGYDWGYSVAMSDVASDKLTSREQPQAGAISG